MGFKKSAELKELKTTRVQQPREELRGQVPSVIADVLTGAATGGVSEIAKSRAVPRYLVQALKRFSPAERMGTKLVQQIQSLVDLPSREFGRIDDLRATVMRPRGVYITRELGGPAIDLNPFTAGPTVAAHEFTHARQFVPEGVGEATLARILLNRRKALVNALEEVYGAVKSWPTEGVRYFYKHDPLEDMARAVAPEIAGAMPANVDIYDQIYRKLLNEAVSKGR